jgi:hypothetical protein
VPNLPRAALLASWGTAALIGACSAERTSDAVAAGVDAGHTVTGLEDSDAALPLPVALGRLRRSGATGLRLVLPRPGDPSTLTGPRDFTEAAVETGSAVLAIGTDVGLLPSGRGVWRAYAVAPSGRAPLTVAEAARALTHMIRDVATELADLDVARWDPAAADLRKGAVADLALPPGWPGPARALLAQALLMHSISDVALSGEGGAVSACEMSGRTSALRRLREAAVRGLEAACSAQPGMGMSLRG